jgi:hypothetical protein
MYFLQGGLLGLFPPPEREYGFPWSFIEPEFYQRLVRPDPSRHPKSVPVSWRAWKPADGRRGGHPRDGHRRPAVRATILDSDAPVHRPRSRPPLAGSRDGCPEALFLARGFQHGLITDLTGAGLAAADTEPMRAGGRTIEVTRLRITHKGRQALGAPGGQGALNRVTGLAFPPAGRYARLQCTRALHHPSAVPPANASIGRIGRGGRPTGSRSRTRTRPLRRE